MKRCAMVLLALLLLAGCAAQPAPPVPPVPAPNPVPSPPPQPGPQFTHLTMADASTGWAWGESGLFRTADGGKSWTNVTPAGGGLTDRAAFEARDGLTAWVGISTVVYRTRDGGKTWETSGLTGDFIRDISFRDEQNGWVLVTNGAATGGTELVSLYRTADGGATWTLTAANQPGDDGLKNFPYPGMKSGVTFVDDQHGFATGGYTNVSQLFFYATRDGGKSWKEQSLTLPELMTKPGPSGEGLLGTRPPLLTRDGALVLPVTSTRCTDDQPCAIIFISTDGGASWQATAPLEEGLTAYDFVDAAHGWVTDGATIFTTADRGQTWSTAPLAEGVTALDFLDQSQGFMLAQGRLSKTVNGGGMWTAE